MHCIVKDGVDYSHHDDGKTHINVYSKSETPLGRWLSNFTRGEVESEVGGTFASMEALYHYLKIYRTYTLNRIKAHQDVIDSLEKLKTTHGREAQILGRDIKQMVRRKGLHTYEVPDAEFERIFTDALVKKLKSNEEMLNLLKDEVGDGKPLLHYYVVGKNTLIHKSHFDWLPDRIMDALEQCY